MLSATQLHVEVTAGFAAFTLCFCFVLGFYCMIGLANCWLVEPISFILKKKFFCLGLSTFFCVIYYGTQVIIGSFDPWYCLRLLMSENPLANYDVTIM